MPLFPAPNICPQLGDCEVSDVERHEVAAPLFVPSMPTLAPVAASVSRFAVRSQSATPNCRARDWLNGV